MKTNGVTITLLKDTEDRWTDLKPKENIMGDYKVDEKNDNPMAGMQDMMKNMY